MLTTPGNLLIQGLAPVARAALLAAAEPLTLSAGHRLSEPGEPLMHAYFPLDAAISTGRGFGAGASSAVIGREGVVGIELILDMPRVEFGAAVQCPGRALKVPADIFQRQLAEHPACHTRMKRYAFACLLQVSQEVYCFGHHLLESRLACQLLLAMIRGGSAHIALTHEALARVLDVRRSGVTLAATALRTRGLVRYARGHIEIVDRERLESLACPCYGSTLRTYTRLLGDRRRTE